MTKSQIKDLIWHACKAILCAVQLSLLNGAAQVSSDSLLELLLLERLLAERFLPFVSLLHPAITIVMFFVLWRYYDTIDDRSFNRFCDLPETRRLFRNPGYLTGLSITILTATPIVASSILRSFTLFGLGGWRRVASIALGLLVVGGGSALRLLRLQTVWGIQKDLPQSQKHYKLSSRILYAIIYFIALYLLIMVGSSVGVVWGSAIFTILRLLAPPVLTAAAVLCIWLNIINPIRNLCARRKFMKRLYKLRDQGELSMTVHGHPYLSVLSEHITFGLTITDAPHPESKHRRDVTYQVAFANCKRRRGTVVLCDRNIYQFLYTFQFSQIARFSHMGAASGGGNIISVPGASWFTSHAFDFPEGEGERILLIDPTPHILAIRGFRAGELMELDNASKVFGYTVFGKNSFVNVLERT